MTEKITVQKNFVYLAAIFGILFLILTPPFQTPDEGNHFKKAYVISEGQFIPSVKEGQEGYYISDEIMKYIAEQETAMGDTDRKFSYSEVMGDEKASVVYEDKNFNKLLTNNIVAHIVPALGIAAGKVVATLAGREPSIVFLLYFARMANLCLYIFCIALSIIITPVLKRTFCMIGLMPMALFLGATPSYDVLIIGMSFLFAALTLQLIYNGQTVWNKKYAIAYGFIAFIYFILKIVYLPLFLVLLCIIINKKSIKGIVNMILPMAITFLVCLVITKLPHALIDSAAGSQDPLVSEQIAFVLNNPLEYLKVFFTTVKESRDFYLSSMVGYFGLVDTQLFSIFIYLYIISLAIVGVADITRIEVHIKWYCRLSIFIAIAAGFFGILLAMYLYWTPVIPGFGVGAATINGVQGRYFIPFLPICFLVFANKVTAQNKRYHKVCTNLVENSCLISIIMLVVSCIMILLRFWI